MHTIVEVEKSVPLVEDKETLNSVASLAGHPGFQFLVRKLALQASKLNSELISTKHTSLESVYFLQSGIHWCHWLQSQLNFAKNRIESSRPATSDEERFFQQIRATIDLVGADGSQAQ
jgi:hypothetical protein